MQILHTISFLPDGLSKVPQQKLSKGLSLLLLVLIAYLLSQFTWLFLSSSTPITQNNSQHVSQKPKETVNYDVSSIKALHLFGEYQKVAAIPQPQEEPEEAPLTRLNLTLMGVVASSNPKASSAIINKSGKQVSYGIEDQIDGTRAVIENIYFDRVILKHAGKLETLMIDEEEFTKAPPRAIKANEGRKVDSRKNNQFSARAAELKETLINNPDKITDYLKISPKRVDGNIEGYRLMPGKDPEFFRESGLKPGDIALQMNGYDLKSPFEAAQALQALRTEKEVTLLVERGEEITEVLFSIQN